MASLTPNAMWPRGCQMDRSRRWSIIIILLVTSAGLCPALLAQHPVVGSIDLYPHGSSYAAYLEWWKNVVYVSGDGAARQSQMVQSVDVADPTDLMFLSGWTTCCYRRCGVKVVEDTLHIAGWGTMLHVFDVSNRGYFQWLWDYSDPYLSSFEIEVANQRAYITATHTGDPSSHGIRIIDVSNRNPPNPADTLISRLQTTDGHIGRPAVRGSYLYYTDGNEFKVANISDENHPYAMCSRDLGNLQRGVCLRGDYAYVHGGDSPLGMRIYDVSNPTSPVQVGQYTQNGGPACLLGNYAFMAAAGQGLVTLDISNPANPHLVTVTHVDNYSDSEVAWEYAVTGNGRYVYVGTQELYYYPPEHPDAGNNYYRGKLYALRVLDQDPDDAGPGRWSSFSLGEASWDTQYEGDVLPTAASPSWQVLEGTETWASVSEGVLWVNDTGAESGDKIKWWRNWDATSSRGATVLVRARCDSCDHGEDPSACPGNVVIEDGRSTEEFSILPDRIRANHAGIEYPIDGTQWHVYRITTQGSQFRVYVDECAQPALTGLLTASTRRARIIFGSGSSSAMQSIYFDYVHCFSNGACNPIAPIATLTPTLGVVVADSNGKGSLSGINPCSARVLWSSDGGTTWNQAGGVLWNVQYEANELPSAASPSWSVPEGSESLGSVDAGVLHVSDTSTASGSKVKWARSWNASASVGTTVLARVRCTAVGGDTTLLGNLFIEDGAHREQFRIMPDRLVTMQSGLTYLLDGTQWHVYRITTKDNQFSIHVDEEPSPVLVGDLATPSTQNRVMFGSGASAGTQEIDFDYVRYTTVGDLPPGQGDGGGPVEVTCAGQCGDDRSVITAHSVPFSTASRTLNKVRFSLRDVAGNLGLSPIYNVPIRLTVAADFDEDNDVDLEDYGALQRCLSGFAPTPAGCEQADLAPDMLINELDLAIFLDCMAGPDTPPACQ